MRLAWQFVKYNGFTMAEGLKQAWLQIKLKIRMLKGIVKFYYQKVNGEIREAYGTLAERMLPATGGNVRTNTTVQTYYDTERQEWRCYKLANLVSIA